LQQEKEILETDLSTANNKIEAIKNQLLANAESAHQQISEIASLKTALEESEAQRMELETTIASLNEKHLQEVTEKKPKHCRALLQRVTRASPLLKPQEQS